MDTYLSSVVESLVQFGVAGLMGMLWVWERAHSRRRETELSEAHARLVGQERELMVLVKLVRQNTMAMVAAERMSKRVCDLLEGIHEQMRDRRDAA